MCVPMHDKLQYRSLLENVNIVHPAACLWGESGDVVLVNGPLRAVSPPVLVSVVSEHSKPECSLFVSERFEISRFSPPLD